MSYVHHTDSNLSRSFVESTTDSGSKKLRAKFVESDKAQMSAYIKDLEKTLQINKQMLGELLSASNLDELHKKSLEKLNQENTHLLQQLKKSMKERDDTQAKLLIAEQMVESFKCKEEDLAAEFEEKNNVVLAELDRKEFELERIQGRYNKAEELLRKYENKDVDVKAFLRNMKAEAKTDVPSKMSNLIEEKEDLTKELANAKKKIEELEMNQHDLITLNNQLKLSINEIKVFGGKGCALGIGKKPSIPMLDFTKIKRPGDKPISDPSYVHKLEESIKYLSKRTQELEEQNRELLQKNMQLQNSNGNLLKLNTTLSNSIQDLREQLAAAQRKNIPHHSANKSQITDPSKRLISTPAIARAKCTNNKINFRQVTDYGRKCSAVHKKGCNSSFVGVLEEPSLELKRSKGVTSKQEEQNEFESGTVEKDQSFGEGMDKNMNAGGECDPYGPKGEAN